LLLHGTSKLARRTLALATGLWTSFGTKCTAYTRLIPVLGCNDAGFATQPGGVPGDQFKGKMQSRFSRLARPMSPMSFQRGDLNREGCARARLSLLYGASKVPRGGPVLATGSRYSSCTKCLDYIPLSRILRSDYSSFASRGVNRKCEFTRQLVFLNSVILTL
jgi:hypothetical protein